MRALLHLPFDLTALYVDGKTILMWHAVFGSVECVEALLQDARVLATINATARHNKGDFNALQMVCETNRRNDAHRSRIIQLLIRAGADINVAP
jgi:ankyrin repeat protein